MTTPDASVYALRMVTLRHIHKYQDDRQMVVLDDGRVGKIVKVETYFPELWTLVSIWTQGEREPGITKVELDRVIGPAPHE